MQDSCHRARCATAGGGCSLGRQICMSTRARTAPSPCGPVFPPRLLRAPLPARRHTCASHLSLQGRPRGVARHLRAWGCVSLRASPRLSRHLVTRPAARRTRGRGGERGALQRGAPSLGGPPRGDPQGCAAGREGGVGGSGEPQGPRAWGARLPGPLPAPRALPGWPCGTASSAPPPTSRLRPAGAARSPGSAGPASHGHGHGQGQRRCHPRARARSWQRRAPQPPRSPLAEPRRYANEAARRPRLIVACDAEDPRPGTRLRGWGARGFTMAWGAGCGGLAVAPGPGA